jgi:hypothetical protein
MTQKRGPQGWVLVFPCLLHHLGSKMPHAAGRTAQVIQADGHQHGSPQIHELRAHPDGNHPPPAGQLRRADGKYGRFRHTAGTPAVPATGELC